MYTNTDNPITLISDMDKYYVLIVTIVTGESHSDLEGGSFDVKARSFGALVEHYEGSRSVLVLIASHPKVQF